MDPHLLRSSSDGQNYSSYIAARTVQAQEKHKMCFCSKFMKLCVCDIFKSELVCVSYVQWVQSGGARVVPVIIGRSRQYYNEVRHIHYRQAAHSWTLTNITSLSFPSQQTLDSNKRIQFLISVEFWEDIMFYFIIFIIPASSESHQNKMYIISYLAISMVSSSLVAPPPSQEVEGTQQWAGYSSSWPLR